MERPSVEVKTGGERPEWHAFRQAWREAASRPPGLPPHEAARRVLARIGPHRARRVGPRLATAAVVLLALALGWWLAANAPVTAPTSLQVAHTTTPLDEGVVLLWLDAETPLYMTFAPPRKSDDKEGES